jgi:putative phage-type endonuclease
LYPGLAATVCASRDEWLTARRHGLGSSDAAALLGVSAGVNAWASPLTLFAEKLDLIDEAERKTAIELLEWGLALEAPIASRYARETGRELIDPGRFTLVRSPEHPFMHATIDRQLVDPDRGPGVLEIKTAGWIKREDWLEEPPLAYQVQVQHQLAVTGFQWGSLAVLIGGQIFRWCDVERNDRFIDALIAREAEFWRRVEAREPPMPDDTAVCLELLRRLFPSHIAGKVVELPVEADTWDQERLQAKADMDAAEARKRLAESQLIAALGDAEIGILPCGVRYSYKSGPRKGYTVAETTVRTLRRLTK